MGNKDYIQAAIESAKPSINFSSNAPPQYKDRQRQYLSKSTKAFVQSKAKYSSDFVGAYVQGLDPSDFYAIHPSRFACLMSLPFPLSPKRKQTITRRFCLKTEI